MLNKKIARVALDSRADEAVKNMINELKREGTFVKVSPSLLVSWIVVKFYQKDFAKHRQNIEKIFFDPKTKLRGLLESGASDTLEDELKDILKRLKQPIKEKRAKVKKAEEEETSFSNDE